jgi:hypothetical protein
MAHCRPAIRPLLAIIAIAVVWYCFLITIAALTANPVQLNALQIKRSKWVVTASIDQSGSVEIRKLIVGEMLDDPIKLTQPLPQPHGEIILPLIREFGDIRITPTNLPKSDRLTYPSNEHTMAQLRQILGLDQ